MMKCKYCSNEYSTLRAVKVHEYYCKSNPNCNTKVTEDEFNLRKEAILNSGVDIYKFGWVEKVSKVTGLTRRQIYKTVNSTDLINYVYRR